MKLLASILLSALAGSAVAGESPKLSTDCLYLRILGPNLAPLPAPKLLPLEQRKVALLLSPVPQVRVCSKGGRVIPLV